MKHYYTDVPMPISRDEISRLGYDAIAQLGVASTVQLVDVEDDATHGHWFLRFSDLAARNPALSEIRVGVQADWSLPTAGREVRLDLRKKLHICPLCQCRASVERLSDRDAYRIECETCNAFDITGDLLRRLRTGYDAADAPTTLRLSRLSAYAKGTSEPPFFTDDNWLGIAEMA